MCGARRRYSEWLSSVLDGRPKETDLLEQRLSYDLLDRADQRRILSLEILTHLHWIDFKAASHH